VSRSEDRIREALISRRVIRVVFKGPRGRDVTLWFFHGVERDYFMLPYSFCTCHDYLINVASRRSKTMCYHLASLKRAIEAGAYRDIRTDPSTAREILLEVIVSGASPTLRKLL